MAKLRQGRGRFRLWVWTLLGLSAVVFWSARLGCQSFAEPPQVAVVGHDAPWRKVANKAIVSVGTDRRTNDIVLYDRKASPMHFSLERRGSKENWWAVLHNRSADKAIELRRAGDLSRKIQVNRYQLRHRDRFLVPLYTNTANKMDRPHDPCSPSQVHTWLRQRSTQPRSTQTQSPNSRSGLKPRPSVDTAPKNRKPKAWATLEVLQHRLDLSLQRHHAQMSWGQKGTRRVLWLDQTKRFKIPVKAGGGLLEYRFNQWQIQRKNRWIPMTKPLQWGTPQRQVTRQRKPRLSMKPHYQLGFVSSPCRWDLLPQSIPAGLAIGQIARLGFQGSRLVLQHTGREEQPIQVLPFGQDARHLGSTSVRSGDSISVGQLTYRVYFQGDRVRLMIARLPQRYILPLAFFASYPSEPFTMRQWLPPKAKLLLTGGEGAQNSTQRWRIPLSLAGTPGKTRITSPYAPFVLLRHLQHDRYQIAPVGEQTIYTASSQGAFQTRQITQPTEIHAGPQLYYTQRLYLRIFQPSYGGLSRWIALLWFLIAGGAVLLLHMLVSTGRVSLAPFAGPSPHQAMATQINPRKSWFAILSLWPIALFLNGLGLYVLAALSLSSLGLNNSSFLYRQFLWSLVGVGLFVAWLGGAERLWPPFVGFVKTKIPEALQSLWYRVFPPSVPGAELLSTPPPSPVSYSVLVGGSLAYFGLCLAVGLVFQSLTLLLPAFVLYLYVGVLAWEYQRNRYDQTKHRSLRFFFITLFFLGIVPIVGLVAPSMVHNRFFLKVPGLGTVKASEFAILTALIFFAHYLGLEIFAIRRNKIAREQTASLAHTNDGTEVNVPVVSLSEVNVGRQRWERLGGAMLVGLLYLLLLGAIGILYTVQGDLGPGLILTCCFSLYLLFAFLSTGADRLTTFGNLLRIATVFLGFVMLFWLPSLLALLFPEWATHSSELQKVQERLALWNQPWRFVVGEQILHNLWNLAGHQGAFQWFNNLHSDFVLTAVVGIFSPWWGYLLIGLACWIPLSTLAVSRHYWTKPSAHDSPVVTQQHQQNMIRALLILFAGIYLFAQNLIHIGSVLRITPMTGVTFTWVSSGGTSLIVCYLVLAMIHRQLRTPA